jgi:hypothetical protein
MSLWAILMASLAVVANMAGQIMTYRLLPAEGKLFKSQVAGTLIGGLVLALLLSAAPGAAPSADVVVAGALLYLVFCYVYFHWNNMGRRPRA